MHFSLPAKESTHVVGLKMELNSIERWRIPSSDRMT
jgi:hypothetical protein